jgi:hypothetical protein
MKIQPNYHYRVMPQLQQAGKVRKRFLGAGNYGFRALHLAQR